MTGYVRFGNGWSGFVAKLEDAWLKPGATSAGAARLLMIIFCGFGPDEQGKKI
jgi:hypothetical protein